MSRLDPIGQIFKREARYRRVDAWPFLFLKKI